MFIHNPTVKLRAGMLLCGLMFLGLLIWFNTDSRGVSQSHPIASWILNGSFVLGIFGCGWTWFLAATLPKPQLPDPAKWAGPNHIPFGTRLWNIVCSVFLIVYGTYGLYIDDITIPSKRGSVHLSGQAAWFLYGAMLCAAANLVAVVVDHFDRRNNELSYLHFSAATQWLGWALFIAALVQGLF